MIMNIKRCSLPCIKESQNIILNYDELTLTPLIYHARDAAGWERADVQFASKKSPATYFCFTPLIVGPFVGNSVVYEKKLILVGKILIKAIKSKLINVVQ